MILNLARRFGMARKKSSFLARKFKALDFFVQNLRFADNRRNGLVEIRRSLPSHSQ